MSAAILAQHRAAIRWLRASYRAGAILDALAALSMLSPSLFAATNGLEDFRPGPDYRYAMGMGASLMLGWTALLLWADRKPLERRGVLLITLFPVVVGRRPGSSGNLGLPSVAAHRDAAAMLRERARGRVKVVFTDGLIVLWRGVAVGLRTTAAALEGLADILDPDEASRDGARSCNATGDAHAPRAGTRERIAETLQRARSRYDAVTVAPQPGRARR